MEESIVGGKYFSTTTTTLRSVPNSYLANLVNGSHVLRDSSGRIFIDRDPKLFETVLQLLRNRKSQYYIKEVIVFTN